MTIVQNNNALTREAAIRESFHAACYQTFQSAVSGMREGFPVGLTEDEETALFEYAADWAIEMWSQLEGMADALADRN